MRKMLFKNKRADDRYLVFWLIFNFVLIVVALYIVVGVFYSTQFDVRQREARILGLRIEDCLEETDSNFLNQDFNIFKECGLSEEIIKNGDYYSKISFSKNGEKLREEIVVGVGKFEIYCELGETAEGDDFPECFENYFIVKDDIKINILTASNQVGAKV